MREILKTGSSLYTFLLMLLFGKTKGATSNVRTCWTWFPPVTTRFQGFFLASINIADGDNQWKRLESQVLSSVIINDFAPSVQCKVIAYISLQVYSWESAPALMVILFISVWQLVCVCFFSYVHITPIYSYLVLFIFYFLYKLCSLIIIDNLHMGLYACHGVYVSMEVNPTLGNREVWLVSLQADQEQMLFSY